MHAKKFALALGYGCLFAIGGAAQDEAPRAFTKRQLADSFTCEGATFGDLNRDGHADVIAGPHWYEGPEFDKKHEIYEPKRFNVIRYSDNFFAFVHDFNGDEWNDILFIGFPGQDASWFENPRGEEKRWTRHLVFDVVDNESPTFEDLDGDGKPEVICQNGDRMGWVAPDWNDPAAPWTFHPLSEPGIGSKFTHGLGVGDVDGDGRKDVLARNGWWRQPESLSGDPVWDFHAYRFADRGGAQMYAYDIDGDGDNDVVSSWNAHGYGLSWFEHEVHDGEITFQQRQIMGEKPEQNSHGVAIGNLHAIDCVDMNGDGLRDLVIGSRFWAHAGRDPADLEPPYVYWLELVRDDDGAHFVPHQIDDDTGVGTQVVAGDINGDGLPDVVIGNKKGVFVHLQNPPEPKEPVEKKKEEAAQAQPPAKGNGYTLAEAADHMTVPEGFSVELVAGEPDLRQPVALAIDERGRVWVAEAHSYPVRRPEGEGQDKIVVFEDTDADGKFEKRTVFADDLNLVSGLQVGFGGVWVGAAPYLLFIPDRDHDLVADGPPVTLLDGWGYGDTHETLNAFTWGPDGWLYGCHGVFTHSRVGAPGTPDADREPLNAGVWRYHPVRHEFEVFAWGSSNPWGVDFDDRGQAFITACVIPHLFHVVQGGRYHRQSGSHFNPYVFDDIKTIADHVHYLGQSAHDGNGVSDSVGGGHAHCGAMIYLGGAFPERYRGAVFMNNIHGNRINTDLLVRDGSGFVGRHGPDFLLANDQWFRGINMKYGPDGAVYFIDWHDQQACHLREPEVWDRSNGRLYRVGYGDGAAIAVDLTKNTDAELVAMHLDQNDWYVRTARRVLQERGGNAEVYGALKTILADNADVTRQLRALWTLHATGGLDDATALAKLGSTEEYVRAWAIQLMTEDGQVTAEQSAELTSLALEDASPVVRLYLASALQRLPLEQRWEIAAGLLSHAEDCQDHNLPKVIWYGVEPLVVADPARALVLAENSQIPLLERYILRRMASGPNPPLGYLVDALARAEDDDRRALILGEMLEGLRLRSETAMPEDWPAVFEALVATDNAEMRNQVRTLAVLFGDRSVLPELRVTLADSTVPQPWREQALQALVRFGDPDVVPILHALLDEPELCEQAIDALASFDASATPALLIQRYDALSEDERRAAVRTLASRAPYTVALLEALVAKQLPSAILESATTRRQIAEHKDPSVQDLMITAWGRTAPRAASVRTEIAHYKDQLSEETLSAAHLPSGRDVFSRTCMVCHKLFDTGGTIGPDITGSNRMDLDYILGNILDPSGEVAKEYMVTVVETKDGRVVSGFVADQNDQTMTLQGAEKTVTVALADIAVDDAGKQKILRTDTSLMPIGQLMSMSDEQVRDLIAYLRSPAQVPLLATKSNVFAFFNEKDLTGWTADPAVWSVENGEIVGKTATGLKRNDFAISDLLLRDFRLVLEVKLTPDTGNSGIQFRSHGIDGGQMKGYQADIGAGWWGKLYEEHGRALLWKEPGDDHVRPAEWNTYEVLAVGPHIQTALNGQPCVNLVDTEGAREGVIGLQLHSGGPMEVRFRSIELELDPKPRLRTVQDRR